MQSHEMRRNRMKKIILDSRTLDKGYQKLKKITIDLLDFKCPIVQHFLFMPQFYDIAPHSI